MAKSDRLLTGIERINLAPGRVGILGVGHAAYWDQFDGLYQAMVDKLVQFHELVKSDLVLTFEFGISDGAESAYRMVKEIQSKNLDLLFIDMVTYATSSSIAIILREIKVPMVLVALQPAKALDYENASTYQQLLNDDICAIPEFMNVALRMGCKMPKMIIGTLKDDPEAAREIREYCQIAQVLHHLKNARIGQMGHVLEAMLDMHTDPTLLTSTFGCHIVQTEPEDVFKHYQQLSDKDVKLYRKKILDFFEQPDPAGDPITERLTEEDLEIAARAGVALNHFIAEKKLDGLAYYYEGAANSDLRTLVTNFIVGNSLLTAAGFPMCGEMDLKTCIAMLIMDRLDMGGSFAEFHPVDFKEDFVLVGHDGPHHLRIAAGKPRLRSLKKYHGKPGSGASVEFQIKTGPITLLGIAQKEDGGFKFIIGEGASKAGPIPPTGNTNTRGFFKPDVRTFLKNWFGEGATHHFALGVGHRGETLQTLADFLGVESVIIR